MPIDERDRRRAIERAAFEEDAALPDASEPTPATLNGPGRVVSVSGGLSIVEIEGTRLQCHIRSKLTTAETSFTNVVAVGDKVIVNIDGDGGGVIEEILPRVSSLTRPDVFHGHRRQVIVANAEQVLIVSSWREPHFWPEFVDRCLIASQLSDLVPIVCINKIDLALEEDAAKLEEVVQTYAALGYRVIKTSAVTGEGVDTLREVLRGKTSVLAGMSGTGKSSLISRVHPGFNLRVSEVSSSSKNLGEGRHTTTLATMFSLDFGGYVVDTPGVRVFGLSGLRRHQLTEFYPEVASLGRECRFGDCSHVEEPDCAVREGLEDGKVHENRYHSYRTIRDTLPE